MFFSFFFLSLIFRDISRLFLSFFSGFTQKLIKAQSFDQNERVLDKC